MPNPYHIPHEVQHAMMSELVQGGCPAGMLPQIADLIEQFFRGYALKYAERGRSQVEGMSIAAKTLARASAVHIAESTMARMADTSQPTPPHGEPVEVTDDDSRKALVMASTTSMTWMGLALLTGAWYAADEGDFSLLGEGDADVANMTLSEFYHYIGDVVEANGDDAAEADREEFRQVSAMAHAAHSEGEGPDDPVVNFRDVTDQMMGESMPGFEEAMRKLLSDGDLGEEH